MPDLRSIQQFQRVLLGVERELTRDALAVYGVMRRELTDVLVTRGAGVLRERVRMELRNTALTIGALGLAQRGAVREAVLRTTREQIEGMRKLDGRVPRFETIRAGVEHRLPVVESKLGDLSVWEDGVRAKLLGTLGRLELQRADTDAVGRRLLSTRVVDGRVSAWRSGKVSLELVIQQLVWGVAAGGLSILYREGQWQAGFEWGKQAVAAVDERTTDCCLRAHGQIKPLDEDFVLVGTPRFADTVDWTPFHWNCRSSVTLYIPEMEAVGVPTVEMRAAALAELDARRDGSREEIHPAHATSRR